MPTSYRHRLIRELIAWKPDVIHSQCEFFTFQYALRISKRTGAPIVHTYHTLYEQYFPYLIPSKRLGNQVVGVMSKKRLKRVKRVIAPTHKVERQLHSYASQIPSASFPAALIWRSTASFSPPIAEMPEDVPLELPMIRLLC